MKLLNFNVNRLSTCLKSTNSNCNRCVSLVSQTILVLVRTRTLGGHPTPG